MSSQFRPLGKVQGILLATAAIASILMLSRTARAQSHTILSQDIANAGAAGVTYVADEVPGQPSLMQVLIQDSAWANPQEVHLVDPPPLPPGLSDVIQLNGPPALVTFYSDDDQGNLAPGYQPLPVPPLVAPEGVPFSFPATLITPSGPKAVIITAFSDTDPSSIVSDSINIRFIPEPASVSLLGLGLLARRRRA